MAPELAEPARKNPAQHPPSLHRRRSTTASPTVADSRRSSIPKASPSSIAWFQRPTTGAGTKHYETSYTFDNTSFGATLYDADAGRVTSMTRSYPTSSILTNLFRYGGSGVLLQNYLAESAVANNMASGGTTGWDDSMDRFGRTTRRMWRNGSSGGTYYKVEPAYDENSNTTKAENIWVTPWSSTYESDSLNRLKELEFGVMTTGAISTVVQKEDWHASGTLKLDQVGNWIDYTRTREGASQDAWLGNTFTKINTYTKFEKGATDVEPEYNPKGLPTKDDKTAATTKGYRYTFDAWDRLVTVKDTSNNLVAEYRYNGLGHRIGWHYDENASGATDGSDDWFYFQYNERWQQVGMWRAGDTAPTEVFVYLNAGPDGYGGSSYIDDCVLRERDINANGSLDERLYYLQNWRHDVVVVMNYDGAVKERLTYDAYGRPHAFSPGDIKRTSGSADRPDGTLDANDTWTTGSVLWNKDLGNASGVAIPNNTVDANDGTTLTNLKTAGYSAGYGLLSTAAIDNRKGYAGYEFDPVLQGAGSVDEKPVYHVRHRVLASDTGKWLQKDPLGYHDSMDLYEYCRGMVVTDVDPFGLASGTCFSCTQGANKVVRMHKEPPITEPTYRPPLFPAPMTPHVPATTPRKPFTIPAPISPMGPLYPGDRCELWCEVRREEAYGLCTGDIPTMTEWCRSQADQCYNNCMDACRGIWPRDPLAKCALSWIAIPQSLLIPTYPPYLVALCFARAEAEYDAEMQLARDIFWACKVARPTNQAQQTRCLTDFIAAEIAAKARRDQSEAVCDLWYEEWLNLLPPTPYAPDPDADPLM